MNKLSQLFAMLAAANPLTGIKRPNPFKRQATPTHKKGSGKTRRGATHVVNPTFKSRRKWPVTPAQYRRHHLGVKESK